jgi:hypothetical protein
MTQTQGIQKTIYEIVKTSRDLSLPYITTHDIIEEAKKTSLAEFANKFVMIRGKEDLEYSQLQAKVWQALNSLKNKKLIRNTSHGKWTTISGGIKYHPITCKALIPEYALDCKEEGCGFQKLVISKDRPAREHCPQCGKMMEVSHHRWHCPIKNSFIGHPEEQCELLHGTDITEKVTRVTPMKPCYCDKTPSKLEVEYMKEKVRKIAEKQDLEDRRASMNIHDPESPGYLPKLHEKKEVQ